MHDLRAVSPPATAEEEERFFDEPVRYSSTDNLLSLFPDPPNAAFPVARQRAVKVLFGSVMLAVLALLAVESVAVIGALQQSRPTFERQD